MEIVVALFLLFTVLPEAAWSDFIWKQTLLIYEKALLWQKYRVEISGFEGRLYFTVTIQNFQHPIHYLSFALATPEMAGIMGSLWHSAVDSLTQWEDLDWERRGGNRENVKRFGILRASSAHRMFTVAFHMVVRRWINLFDTGFIELASFPFCVFTLSYKVALRSLP